MLKLGINPWKTIWTTPRKTIRSLVDYNPRTGFYTLSAIFFLDAFFFFNSFLHLSISYRLAITILIAVIVSPVLGGVWCYFFSWVAGAIGKLFHGKATYIQLRTAFTWSKVPLLINLLMWLCFVAFSPPLLFLSHAKGYTAFFMYMIIGIGALWSFMILILCISEVENVSILRGLYITCLTYVIFIIFFLALFFVLKFSFSF